MREYRLHLEIWNRNLFFYLFFYSSIVPFEWKNIFTQVRVITKYTTEASLACDLVSVTCIRYGIDIYILF